MMTFYEMFAIVCLILFADRSLIQENYPIHHGRELLSSEDACIKVNLECHVLNGCASIPSFLRYLENVISPLL